MKKIGILALALVLALGALGVGFALWSETLYIEGMVETGDLEADWILVGYGDTELPEKDVSYVDAYVCGKTLYITVYNAYPCIDYYVDFEIYNSGTIPLHVCGFNYDLGNMGSGEADFVADFVIYISGASLQLHPGESLSFTLNIHLNNLAIQGETYWFTLDWVAAQYNEDCPPTDVSITW
jgi:hypothetical protein